MAFSPAAVPCRSTVKSRCPPDSFRFGVTQGQRHPAPAPPRAAAPTTSRRSEAGEGEELRPSPPHPPTTSIFEDGRRALLAAAVEGGGEEERDGRRRRGEGEGWPPEREQGRSGRDHEQAQAEQPRVPPYPADAPPHVGRLASLLR
jgi:hypothetical protein